MMRQTLLKANIPVGMLHKMWVFGSLVYLVYTAVYSLEGPVEVVQRFLMLTQLHQHSSQLSMEACTGSGTQLV